MGSSSRPRTRLVVATASIAALAAIALAATAIAGNGPQLKTHVNTKINLVTKSVNISGSDNPQRFEVYCPGGQRPLGGGVLTSPTPDAAGNGAFPAAYERLGAQDGWHVTVAQVGRQGSTDVTVQVLCRKYAGNVSPVEHFIKSQDFKNVDAGQTKQFTEKCPGNKRIITGGYLTSHFFSTKGVYVTESRMASQKSWTISATGVAGGSGGQVTAIAYCAKSKKPLVTEVQSAPAAVTTTATGTATAPPCPGSKDLIAGGFSAPPTVRVFDGGFRGLGTWAASGAAYTGPGDVTAFGYCY